jgi:hypothetical protein
LTTERVAVVGFAVAAALYTSLRACTARRGLLALLVCPVGTGHATGTGKVVLTVTDTAGGPMPKTPGHRDAAAPTGRRIFYIIWDAKTGPVVGRAYDPAARLRVRRLGAPRAA